MRFAFFRSPVGLIPWLLLVSAAAANDLYKCVDQGYGVTYTNTRLGPHCTLISRSGNAVTAPTPAKAPRAAANPSPADFPKVSVDAQKSRDTDRRKILEQELAAEQKGLDESRKSLNDQEAAKIPAPQTQPLRDRIALHERNLQALRKELGNLR